VRCTFFRRHFAGAHAVTGNQRSGCRDAPSECAVVDRATREPIGSTRYHDYDAERSEVEIGWTFLGRAYWGGTYNGELKRLMLGHAFESVDRVVFCIAHENIRSQRSVEKLGARRGGERRGMLLYELGA